MAEEIVRLQVEDLVDALGASWGDPPYYAGVLQGVPFLFKEIGGDLPGYLFKFREARFARKAPPVRIHQKPLVVSAPEAVESEESESLPPNAPRLETDDDGKYLWVWVRNASALTGVEVADLVRKEVASHSQLFQAKEGECMKCREVGEAKLRQEDGEVSLVCDKCLEARKEIQEAVRAKLEEPVPFHSFFGVIILLATSAAWAGLWFAMGLLPAQRFLVPLLLYYSVFAILPVLAGKPIGIMLRRAGTAAVFPHGALAFVFTVIVVLLGEAVLASIYVYLYTGYFHIMATLIGMKAIFQDLTAWGWGLRITSAICLGIGIQTGCRTPRVPVSI
ncbi:MAG: hypothetical protein QM755_01015 [Luteolibacter sp.]